MPNDSKCVGVYVKQKRLFIYLPEIHAKKIECKVIHNHNVTNEKNCSATAAESDAK